MMSQFGYTCSSSDALLLASDCSLMDELIPIAARPSVLQLPLSTLALLWFLFIQKFRYFIFYTTLSHIPGMAGIHKLVSVY